MTNKHKKVLYIGVTNNLRRRVFENEPGILGGFTKKYSCHYLIFYEHFTNINYALRREKEIKKSRREKKNNLVSEFNPEWKFLNMEIESI